jgi:hypothetical protein
MKTLLLLALLTACVSAEKPKEIHLRMCELSCKERRPLEKQSICSFSSGNCYYQRKCFASDYRKHESLEDAIWMSIEDCYLYKLSK